MKKSKDKVEVAVRIASNIALKQAYVPKGLRKYFLGVKFINGRIQ